MRKGGAGGNKTITGLRFESRISLMDAVSSIPDYTVSNDGVFFKGIKIAELYGKYKLYKKLLKPRGVDYTRILSKRLIPDDAILILKDRELFIVEIKFQQVGGSVDEKLQTCDFKKKQYTKLLSPLGIAVKYVYVLSNWFNKKEYRDTLDYIKSVGCHYFFNEIPFEFLGFPKPS